jgi:hypothetical protein
LTPHRCLSAAVAAGSVQRRCDAKGEPGGENDGNGKQQNHGVDSDLIHPSDAGGRESCQRGQNDRAGEDAERSAYRCQDQPLGQSLTQEASARRTERSSNCHLPHSRRGARHHEIGDIGARNQQHETDSTEQNPERLLDAREVQIVKTHHDGTFV